MDNILTLHSSLSLGTRVSGINWLVEDREIFRELVSDLSLLWLMMMVKMMMARRTREARIPMVAMVPMLISLELLATFQSRDRPFLLL